MVEMQISESKSETGKENTANIDITKIINKVKGFVDDVRDLW